MLAATAAWFSGVAVAEAEIETAVEDIMGVVIEALEETGAEEATEDKPIEDEIVGEEATEDEATDEKAALEADDEAGMLKEELPDWAVTEEGTPLLEAGKEEKEEAGSVEAADEGEALVKALPEGEETELEAEPGRDEDPL
jgi:hypothetical protein